MLFRSNSQENHYFNFTNRVHSTAHELCRAMRISTTAIVLFDDDTYAYLRHPEDVNLPVDPGLMTWVVLGARDYENKIQMVVTGPQGALGPVGQKGVLFRGPIPVQPMVGP